MENPIISIKLFNSIENYISTIIKEFSQIPEERKAVLHSLTEYIRSKKTENKPVQLTFICTHNSRRSHLSQIWAQIAAHYYGIQDVKTYSGGTEATAFNPRAVKAIVKAGFQIKQTGDHTNPTYLIKFTEDLPPIKAFSKVYNEAGNPKKDFAAIMTCSQADEACPFITGADVRIPIMYEDPKEFDGTEQEEGKYDERTRQIATELFYAFSLVNKSERE